MASFAMALSMNCLADEFPVLMIKTNVTESSIQLKDINKVQYTETEMVVKLNDGTTKVFVIEDITSMDFDNININTAIQTLDSKEQQGMTIFDLKGIKKGNMNNKGIYIIKVGKETKKIKK